MKQRLSQMKGIVWRLSGMINIGAFSSHSCERILFNRETELKPSRQGRSPSISCQMFFFRCQLSPSNPGPPPSSASHHTPSTTTTTPHPTPQGSTYLFAVCEGYNCHAFTRGIPRSKSQGAVCGAALTPTQLLQLLGAALAGRQNIGITNSSVRMLQSRGTWPNYRRGAEKSLKQEVWSWDSLGAAENKVILKKRLIVSPVAAASCGSGQSAESWTF